MKANFESAGTTGRNGDRQITAPQNRKRLT
jgi:hypothetical protein